MRQRWAFVKCLLLIFSLAILTGCPLQTAILVASRDSISFSDTSVSASFTVRNSGQGTLNWSVQEVTRASEDAPWVAADIPWLSADPTAGASTGESDRVILTADRDGLPVGTIQNTGVRINSNGGEKIIPVSITVIPSLTVSPTVVPLAPASTIAQFTVVNAGAETATWEVLFLLPGQSEDQAQPLPAGIQVEPNPGSTAPASQTVVAVSFPEGQTDFSLLVRSERGSGTVTFRFGAALEGLTVTPSPLTVYVNPSDGETPAEQVATPMHIINSRGVIQSWTLEIVSRIDSTTPPISATPPSGSTPANDESIVDIRVTDPTTVVSGSGNYDLILQSGDGFLIVPLIVEVMPLPEIELSEPPEATSSRPEVTPINFIDFGRESVQAQFFVTNVGPRGSKLSFKITHDDQDVENPLIVAVEPLQGDTNGPEEVFFFPPDSNLLIDAEAITVTVDRSALTEEVEERIITVQAFDEDFENPLEVVDSKTLRIRVERPPLEVEGALNRARPPFLSRFTFLLRDDLGRVIETRTPGDRARISFRLTENDLPLDTDETNTFVEGPGALKVNLVLLLDFTGSMYRAGTTDTENPLEPGEALAQVKEAALKFLDDLPPTYQVALMYYNDRQQRNRLLAPFSTDRASLKAALTEFTLPAAQFGTSAIFDALEDAVLRLVAEDPADTLPFDDADVRAVVFITDGKDTGSVIESSQVIDLARDSHVQLYPLGYSAGGTTNVSDMVVFADETNGHFYSAGNVLNLVKLLGNEKALGLVAASNTASDATFFQIANEGQTGLSWTIEVQEGIDWITGVSPSGGSTAVGGSTLVRVSLDPALAPADRLVEGKVLVSSSNGTGEVTVRMRTTAAGGIESVETALADEPGRVWSELRNQIVLSYLTPSQSEGTYQVFATYTKPDDQVIQGMFEEDGLFFPGDVFAGQLALRTSGIFEDPLGDESASPIKAEAYVRAEYMPRGVNRFRLRVFTALPEGAPGGAQAQLDAVEMSVELAPNGLLIPDDEFDETWRLVSQGDGIYVMLTEAENPLPYGAFGNLLKITFSNLEPYLTIMHATGNQGDFLLGMRVDNDIYFSPETPGHPSETKYFLYPGGKTFPDRQLLVSEATSDLAPPARTAVLLQSPGINPEAAFAFDRDEDGLSDFQDPEPDVEDQPGTLVTPDRLEIDSDEDSGILVVRNNRLDTFAWSLDETALPPWMTVVYEDPLDPQLSPGELAVITVNVDRTGLPGGFNTVNVPFDLGIFGEQVVPVVVIVAE